MNIGSCVLSGLVAWCWRRSEAPCVALQLLQARQAVARQFIETSVVRTRSADRESRQRKHRQRRKEQGLGIT